MNILLACAGGMSTSLVVSKMQNLSKEDKIWAAGCLNVVKEAQDADVLLLGPQIGYRKEELSKALPIPVGVICHEWFGLIQADKILEYAKELTKNQA